MRKAGRAEIASSGFFYVSIGIETSQNKDEIKRRDDTDLLDRIVSADLITKDIAMHERQILHVSYNTILTDLIFLFYAKSKVERTKEIE